MENETDKLLNEQVIKSIDFELDLVNKEFARPGWTKWAIYGSFGALGWLLITLLEHQNFSFTNIAQLYLVFHFASSSFGFLKTIYPENEFQLNNLQKFNRASNFVDFEVLGSNFILNLVDLSIAVLVFNDVWVVQIVLIATTLILVLAIQILQFWQLNVEFPSSLNNNKSNFTARIIGFVFGGIISLVLIWAVSGYFGAAYNRGFNSIDIKIALLLFVFSFLFKMLFTKPIPTKIKNSLIELRRLIVFDEIGGAKAKFELKKITGKLTPSEFIKDFYQECQMDLLFQSGSISNSSKILNEIKELVSGETVKDDSIVEKLREENFNKISFEQRKKYVDYQIKKFNKEVKRIKFFLRYDDGELDEMERSINETNNLNIKNHGELERLRKNIFDEFDTDSSPKLNGQR